MAQMRSAVPFTSLVLHATRKSAWEMQSGSLVCASVRYCAAVKHAIACSTLRTSVVAVGASSSSRRVGLFVAVEFRVDLPFDSGGGDGDIFSGRECVILYVYAIPTLLCC